jgi:RNA polymerase sigma-70 factor (ECF subfamily)
MIYAYQTLNDREEAMDMVQEAFTRFFKEEEKVREPKAWLYRTTRNLCISHLRKHGRMKIIGEEEQMDFLEGAIDRDAHPAKQMERKEARGRVRHALSMLPDDLRELIRMKFDEKMSYKEISEKSGLSVSNVGYKLHTVIKDLAVDMKAEGFAS